MQFSRYDHLSDHQYVSKALQEKVIRASTSLEYKGSQHHYHIMDGITCHCVTRDYTNLAYHVNTQDAQQTLTNAEEDALISPQETNKYVYHVLCV